ncbi:MAG: hypothetical protein WBA91_04090 [Paracoccaceae bacterium]
MTKPTLTSYAIAALLSCAPMAISAENLIEDKTWADAEGCRVLAGGFRGQAFTILSRNEIRFWEINCTVVDTMHVDGKSLRIETTCEDGEQMNAQVFYMGGRIGQPIRLTNEAGDWEALLSEC